MSNVLVTGGGGYVGCRLVPALMRRGHNVRVLDIFLFGDNLSGLVPANREVDIVAGDIRDGAAVRNALDGIDAVIHLAAIANDPGADLDHTLTKQVNYHAVIQLVDLARAAGVARFINASTATVYGVKEGIEVTEYVSHDPVSLYGRYKSESEAYVLAANIPGFTTVSLRAATVCGFSPRQRLDLTVNILTHQALEKNVITVFGGRQMRPHITISDLTRAYIAILEARDEQVAGHAFNVGNENYSVMEVAERVRRLVGPQVDIRVEPVFDQRSYRLSSEKIRRQLGFAPRFGVEDAARDLVEAFRNGLIPHPEDTRYYNLRHMQSVCFR